MLLATLFACADKIVHEDGEELVRGALFYEIPDPAQTIQFEGGRAAVVVVANSPIPCRPETSENDPTTLQDEAAEAEDYWLLQLGSAFTREGAFVVGFVVFVDPDVEMKGEYHMASAALDDADDLVALHPRLSTGFWLHVEEAGVLDDDEEGGFGAWEVIAQDGEDRLDDPAQLTITAESNEEVSGHFDLDPDEVTGTFTAEVCDNDELMDLVFSVALAAGLL
ncbi:MAG: hypothetical protein ACOZNI_24300 [Myxococcota bacterium]